jgi:uncharacterized membrane protein
MPRPTSFLFALIVTFATGYLLELGSRSITEKAQMWGVVELAPIPIICGTKGCDGTSETSIQHEAALLAAIPLPQRPAIIPRKLTP